MHKKISSKKALGILIIFSIIVGSFLVFYTEQIFDKGEMSIVQSQKIIKNSQIASQNHDINEVKESTNNGEWVDSDYLPCEYDLIKIDVPDLNGEVGYCKYKYLTFKTDKGLFYISDKNYKWTDPHYRFSVHGNYLLYSIQAGHNLDYPSDHIYDLKNQKEIYSDAPSYRETTRDIVTIDESNRYFYVCDVNYCNIYKFDPFESVYVGRERHSKSESTRSRGVDVHFENNILKIIHDMEENEPPFQDIDKKMIDYFDFSKGSLIKSNP